MTLRFFNTLTRKKDKFTPLEDGLVRIYTCGPTVYDYAHIGNFRTYVFEDLLRRHLKAKGYRVMQVMNITDVEDKIIRRAHEQGIDLNQGAWDAGADTIPLDSFTDHFIEAFHQDRKALGIEDAEFYPRATRYIPQMVTLIRRLMDRGVCYTSDDSIYYSISRFENYGCLSGFRLDEVKAGARVDQDEYDKDDARDFVLWKGRRDDEVYWETPFGEGRPGWHIECSAMAMELLGEQLDIHCGGEDNIFPHHENEIAQSECATGRRFVNYWLHSRHLRVEGAKMAKSAGNFFTLRDLQDRGYDPINIRFLLIRQHYRDPLNFTFEGLKAASEERRRWSDLLIRLDEIKTPGELSDGIIEEIDQAGCQMEAAMDDDLNSPQAIARLHEFTTSLNRRLDAGELNAAEALQARGLFEKMNNVFGVLNLEREVLDSEIEALIEERLAARKGRDFARADEIRDQLAAQGIILEDTAGGTRWKRGE